MPLPQLYMPPDPLENVQRLMSLKAASLGIRKQQQDLADESDEKRLMSQIGPAEVDNPDAIFSKGVGNPRVLLSMHRDLMANKAAKLQQQLVGLQLADKRAELMKNKMDNISSAIASLDDSVKNGDITKEMAQTIWEGSYQKFNDDFAAMGKDAGTSSPHLLTPNLDDHDQDTYRHTAKYIQEGRTLVQQHATEKRQELADLASPEGQVKTFAQGLKSYIDDQNFDPEKLNPTHKAMLMPIVTAAKDSTAKIPELGALMDFVQTNRRMPDKPGEYKALLDSAAKPLKESQTDEGAPPDRQSAQNAIDAQFDPSSKDPKVIAANARYSKLLNGQVYSKAHGANVVKQAGEEARATVGSEPWKEFLAASNFNRNNPDASSDDIHKMALEILNSPNADNAEKRLGVTNNKTLTPKVRSEIFAIMDEEARTGKPIEGMQNLTSQTRSLGEAAHSIIPAVDHDIETLSDPKIEAVLGPMGSRWQNFLIGTVGTSDPTFTGLPKDVQAKLIQLRVSLGLDQTGIARAHIGARGSGQLQAKFEDLFNISKMDAFTARNALKGARDYLSHYDQTVNRDNAIDRQKKGGGGSIPTNPSTNKPYAVGDSVMVGGVPHKITAIENGKPTVAP